MSPHLLLAPKYPVGSRGRNTVENHGVSHSGLLIRSDGEDVLGMLHEVFILCQKDRSKLKMSCQQNLPILWYPELGCCINKTPQVLCLAFFFFFTLNNLWISKLYAFIALGHELPWVLWQANAVWRGYFWVKHVQVNRSLNYVYFLITFLGVCLMKS